MGFQAEVLRVLIASPSDVHIERNEIESAIFEWNVRFAEELQVVLLPGRWENDVVPAYGESDPQQIINEQLVSKCDILVGVFWTKLGTPTTSHASGTLEEINIFIEQGKEVMLYFVDRDIPRHTNFDEVKKVDEFKGFYGEKGVYGVYDPTKIIGHLYRKVISLKRRSNLSGVTVETKSNIAQIEVVSLGVEDNENNLIEQVLVSDKLTGREILLLGFILDTGTRNFGVRWMMQDTLKIIEEWESKRLLVCELTKNYMDIINNFVDRGFLEPKEYTSHQNVRLYSMPLKVYDDLRALPDKIKNKIDEEIDSHMIF